MRSFTRQELVAYDGRDGVRAYVAYQGRVYDVSDRFLWRGGRHWATHQAGIDLTEAIPRAPHRAELLERCPQIGVLVD